MFRITTCLKAIYAALFAGLTGVGTALVEAHTFAAVSDASWITVAALTLSAGGAVYGVTNSPASALLTSIGTLAEPIAAEPVAAAPVVKTVALPPPLASSGSGT